MTASFNTKYVYGGSWDWHIVIVTCAMVAHNFYAALLSRENREDNKGCFRHLDPYFKRYEAAKLTAEKEVVIMHVYREFNN